MWQPASKQWLVIVVTFVLIAFVQFAGLEDVGRRLRAGAPNPSEVANLWSWIFLIAGGLLTWFLEGRRSK